MVEFFACIGLGLLSFGVIFGLTALCGFMADDDDRTLRWILSCMIAAGLAATLVMTNIR